jgi:large subunit ribosomal protein L4
MATVEVRDASGGVTGSRELPAEIFERPVNVPLMHQVVVAGAAAARAGTHSTKTRGQVAGGGAKPWRQKGTGRARQGSIRSPQWAGGGVAHGPKPRDHSVRINKKMKRAALRSALSDASAGGRLAVVEAIAFEEPKTKAAVALLDALGLSGRILVVVASPDEDVEKSFRNLPFVKVVHPGSLSTFDLLAADRVLFTTDALDGLIAPKAEVTEPAQDAPAQPETEPVSEPETELAPPAEPAGAGEPGAEEPRSDQQRPDEAESEEAPE